MENRTIRRVLSICSGVLALACGPGALAQPANDHCSGATLIVANLVYHSTNSGAGSDLFQSSCGAEDNRDVWFRFTAAGAGDYTIDTYGSALDTTLAVYGACGGAELACNDDFDPGFGTDSLVDVTLTAGQSIRIRVAGYGQAVGAFDIFITPPTTQPTTGACCRGSTCAVASPGECTGANTSFAGAGIACNAPGNSTTPCCKADFDHAGGLTIQDVFAYLNAWFGSDPATDFNGSGGIEIQDIFDFLNAWFAGC